MNGCRRGATVPSGIECGTCFGEKAVVVEQGEVDLDLGLLDGALGRTSVEQVEVEGQRRAVVGDVA